MARETNQIKFYVDEDMRKELNQLEEAHPDFKPSQICKEALKMAIKRYKTDLTRIEEDIKQIKEKINILDQSIDTSKKNRYNLKLRLELLEKNKEELEAEEEERSPRMLFRTAVYRLSSDIGEYGAPDTEKADILAKEIGVPVDLLVKTAEDLHYHKISLDEVEDRLPNLDIYLGK